ncbi:hypothetical protein [Plasticicumulans acidivorans]|uniref:hypothetical protein n=1 Tax=Plasticicumulans acidivorans TaxID=886464 RepID=UPI003CCC64BC
MQRAQQSDAQIMAVVDPIMDNLMAASTAIDYERHARDFTERARSGLSHKALQSICEHYRSRRGFSPAASGSPSSGVRTRSRWSGGSGLPARPASSSRNGGRSSRTAATGSIT